MNFSNYYVIMIIIIIVVVVRCIGLEKKSESELRKDLSNWIRIINNNNNNINNNNKRLVLMALNVVKDLDKSEFSNTYKLLF